jgi:hypothetical protein
LPYVAIADGECTLLGSVGKGRADMLGWKVK